MVAQRIGYYHFHHYIVPLSKMHPSHFDSVGNQIHSCLYPYVFLHGPVGAFFSFFETHFSYNH
ncbi:hypothetical protein HanIR_Chr11g0552551 [Helianthus annuus]|nr:hypothetical protein HanIR_Chr11g0552551 [Helianthus annuus]